MKQKVMRTRQGGAGNAIFSIVLFIILVLFSLSVAYAWHVLSGDAEAEKLPSSSFEVPVPPTSNLAYDVIEPPVVQPLPTPNSPATSSGSSSDGSGSSGDSAQAPADGVTVPASERVRSDYFDDAVFVGDSLTEGIRGYSVMENTTVLAITGLGIDNFFTREGIKDENGNRITVQAALDSLQPAKIYLMLGTNALGYDKDSFKAAYAQVVAALKSAHPGCTIYVQSMLPVTSNVQEKYPTVSNEKINEYNEYIKEVCQEQGVWYVNVHEALVDENGELPLEASPTDGIHFGRTYYEKWFEYLKTHVASSAAPAGSASQQ